METSWSWIIVRLYWINLLKLTKRYIFKKVDSYGMQIIAQWLYSRRANPKTKRSHGAHVPVVTCVCPWDHHKRRHSLTKGWQLLQLLSQLKFILDSRTSQINSENLKNALCITNDITVTNNIWLTTSNYFLNAPYPKE